MSFTPSRLASTSTSNTVTLNSDDTVYQGGFYSSTVYIDSLENISSLKITVYFDSSLIEVNSTYNYVTCSLYDSSINDDNISYSYIFGSDTSNIKTSLFCFYYSIKSDATLGNTYFDILVDEAYDSSLNVIEVFGSRKRITIKESKQLQTIYIYGTSSISSKKEQEFDISYYFYNYQIASGTIEITYDQELFEFVSLTNGNFLINKLVDYNSSIKGTVSLSFIGTTYSYNSDLFTVKFKTIGNQDTTLKIKLTVKEFYDVDLNQLLCDGYTTTVNLTYDSEYDESLPKMSLSSKFDATENKLEILIKLSSNSKLGAGDFILTWNKSYFEYVSYTKKFSPTYFNVNTKETSDGKLKFSILSLTDITEANDVISISFNVTNPHDETSFPFEIKGTGLTDSLTNEIKMNFINCNQVVTGKCTFGDWTIKENATCTKDGVEHRICTVCGKEETRVISILDAKQCFVDTVNSFDLVNDDKEVLKSKIDEANSYYQYIADKDSVSDSYSKYLEAVDYYNKNYKDNSKSSNNNFIYIVIGSIGGVCLLIGILIFVILKKKKASL